MKTLIPVICTLFLFTNCKQWMEKSEPVVINNQYQIDIPSMLTKMELNDVASLEYGNGLQELYVIVIDEEKSAWEEAVNQYGGIVDSTLKNDFESYRNYLMDGFEDSIFNENFKTTKPVTVNNMNGYLYEIEGSLSGLDVFYYYTFVEGKDHYYQIMTWTLKDRSDSHKKQMVDMTNSFKEL